MHKNEIYDLSFVYYITLDENAEFVTFIELNQWSYAGNGATRGILSVSFKAVHDVMWEGVKL